MASFKSSSALIHANPAAVLEKFWEQMDQRSLWNFYCVSVAPFYTHTCWSRHQLTLHVQMSTDAVSKSTTIGGKTSPWDLLTFANIFLLVQPFGQEGEGDASCWYTLCCIPLRQQYSCPNFFPFVLIKTCLCSLEAQQTHNKPSHNVKHTLRWNNKSL